MTNPVLTPPPQEVDWRDTTVSEVLETAGSELEVLASDRDWAKVASGVWEALLEPTVTEALKNFKQKTGRDLTVGEVLEWLQCVGLYTPDMAAEIIAGAAFAWNEEWNYLTPCATWGLAHLGTCAYRSMLGRTLSADMLDWWLDGAIHNDSIARTETFNLPDGDGVYITSKARYIPLSASEIWSRIGDDLILKELGGVYDSLLKTICVRLHAPPDVAFPDRDMFLAGGGIFYTPSVNGLLKHGKQTLYLEYSFQMNDSIDADLGILNESALLSEVHVSVTPVNRTDSTDGGNLEGWEVKLENWRFRLWDNFDFHDSTGLHIYIPGKGLVWVPDYVFTRLIANPCPGLPAPADYLLMADSWTDVPVSQVGGCSMQFFLPRGIDCNELPLRITPL